MIDNILKKVAAGTNSVLAGLEGERAAAEAEAEGGVDLGALDHGALKRKLKDFALEKVVDRVDQFEKALPIFESVGFVLRRIDIEIGLSPGVIARFDIVRPCSEAEAQRALAKLVSDPTLQGVLNSMLKACRLHKVLRVGSLELIGVAVTIGTMPSVRLVFGEDGATDDEA